ncbi:hypothetical protein PFISCL1PPCAC_13899, partial [Pristionchus fissidentatus]
AFTYGLFALSLITNGFFIAIAMTTASDSIGRYRFLMSGFALMDILVAANHMFMMPSVQMTPVGYIFFGYHLIEAPAWVGTYSGVLFVIFFYQTFIILAFHYIYRYAVVCDPFWCKWFSSKYSTRNWMLIAFAAQILYTLGFYEVVKIGFMPSEYKLRYHQPIILNATGIDISQLDFGYLAIMIRKSGGSGGEVWERDAVVSILGAFTLCLLTVIVILLCCVLIMKELDNAKSMMMSKVTRSMHGQLLKALLVQTAIPTVFTYIPLGTIFVAPFIGFDLAGIFGDLLIMSCAVFPALDPIIMIYFVR